MKKASWLFVAITLSLFTKVYAQNLFVANEGNNTVTEFNSSGVGTVFASSGLNDPCYLTFDSNGNLYAANWGNSTVEEFNSSGMEIASFGPSLGINRPVSVAIDSSGNLYVANQGNQAIEEISNGWSRVFATGLDFPGGPNGGDLAFDSNGNLYASNSGSGTIEEFNANGVGTVFASGLDTPAGLAFQPVPEPATWALLALGMGALFGGCRLSSRLYKQ